MKTEIVRALLFIDWTGAHAEQHKLSRDIVICMVKSGIDVIMGPEPHMIQTGNSFRISSSDSPWTDATVAVFLLFGMVPEKFEKAVQKSRKHHLPIMAVATVPRKPADYEFRNCPENHVRYRPGLLVARRKMGRFRKLLLPEEQLQLHFVENMLSIATVVLDVTSRVGPV